MLWGTTGTAQALGGAEGSPLTVGAFRLFIGSLGLLVIGRRYLTRPPVGWLALSAVAMAAYQVTFFSGVARAGVALGTVIAIGSAPIFAGLLAWVIRKERPTRRWAIATAMAIVGVAMVAGQPDQSDPLGLTMALGAGLTYAVYALGSKYLVERIHPTGAMAMAFSAAALLMLPLLANADLAWIATAKGATMAVWLGLGATTLSYVLFARGLKTVPLGHAATLTLAEPATAAVLGIVLLGERPGLNGWLGIAVVMGAVALLGGSRVGPSLPDEPRLLGA